MKKSTVETCFILSISNLKKWGWLPQGGRVQAGGHLNWAKDETRIVLTGVRIDTSVGEAGVVYLDNIFPPTGVKQTQTVKLISTPCNYGGVQYWFVCPCWRGGVEGKYCGRKVSKLYLPLTAYEFGCRHCYNLSYASRNVLRPDRDGHILMNKLMQLTYGKDWINHPDVQDTLKGESSDEKV
ncbi:hypothetical protein LCGC14_2392660 [marine sediment metagenome]|uniref:Uncharacterized protein n=1 Tax=marine sediment metagenome TaxID=412755 RepID=A0A0F9BXR9_9ZZZZ